MPDWEGGNREAVSYMSRNMFAVVHGLKEIATMGDSMERHIVFRYTNWRGETATRTVLPHKIWFGSTEWHPEEQWFLTGEDVEKGEIRDFALVDIVFEKKRA